MTKYIKKPIPIEAEPYREGLEDGFEQIVEMKLSQSVYDAYKDKLFIDTKTGLPFASIPYIQTLEGRHYILPDDYIITGVRGERYPCKKDIFEETYEVYEEIAVVCEHHCKESCNEENCNICKSCKHESFPDSVACYMCDCMNVMYEEV